MLFRSLEHGSGDPDEDRKYNNRSAGYERAAKRLRKEEVEIDEANKENKEKKNIK